MSVELTPLDHYEDGQAILIRATVHASPGGSIDYVADVTNDGGRVDIGPHVLAALLGAGQVYRAPATREEWNLGDLAKHIETGQLYYHRELPYPQFVTERIGWLRLDAVDASNPWHTMDELAGKLELVHPLPDLGQESA